MNFGDEADRHCRQLFGSPGRDEATGRGIMYVLDEAPKDIQQFRWELDRINHELETTMRRAYAAVRQRNPARE